jgi:hypothetical protein
MIIKIKLDRIPVFCATRESGFMDAVLAAGKTIDGEFRIDSEDWQRLTVIHRKHKKPFGLGDAVATVAQPIARAIDAVAGTKIAECGGCSQRRDALNRLVPRL